jgi:hypothetical protein
MRPVPGARRRSFGLTCPGKRRRWTEAAAVVAQGNEHHGRGIVGSQGVQVCGSVVRVCGCLTVAVADHTLAYLMAGSLADRLQMLAFEAELAPYPAHSSLPSGMRSIPYQVWPRSTLTTWIERYGAG